MYKFKNIMKGILNLLVKVLIVDTLVVGVIYFITINLIKLDIQFRSVLEVAAIFLLLLTTGSYMGGRKMTNTAIYINMFGSSAKNKSKEARDEIKSIRSDYGLMATTGIGGLVLLIVTLFI